MAKRTNGAAGEAARRRAERANRPALPDRPPDVLRAKVDTLSDLLRSIEDAHYPTSLDRVQALRMIAETAHSALRQAVPVARADGGTWTELARVLGVSPQAVQQRYGQS